MNKGGSINLMVSLSSNAQYTMDIYRMGWYPTGTNPDGTSCAPSCGGRLMLHVGPLNGTHQAKCPTVTTQNDPNFGLTECNWTPSYTLNVPTSWTTGNYIVKLRRLDGQQLENYMTFVVRDDSSTAPVVYSMDVTTWQAYNFWGGDRNANVGYDLYGALQRRNRRRQRQPRLHGLVRPPVPRARVAGRRRLLLQLGLPDGPLDGVEGLRHHLRDVTSTSSRTRTCSLATGSFMNTGHDEYYSDNMRTAIPNGIAGGVDMAFFSANNFYYRITWAAERSGAANRRIHSRQERAPGLDDLSSGGCSRRCARKTSSAASCSRASRATRPFLVSDASSWIYAGTGLHNYTGNGTTGVITSGREPERPAGDHRLRVRRSRVHDLEPVDLGVLRAEHDADGRPLICPRG